VSDASKIKDSTYQNIGASEAPGGNSDMVVSGTFNDYTEDDSRKKLLESKKVKKELSEAELDTNIYISLCETETNILFNIPSTKYFINKNGKVYIYIYIDNDEKDSKKRDEAFQAYLHKRKNPDSFEPKGSQTINSFRLNQVVSTSSFKDQEIDANISEKVNALRYEIFDTSNAARNKKDDENKIIQKKMEKKIKQQLKSKIAAQDILLDVESSYSLSKSHVTDSVSMMDTQSLQSSKRPRPNRGVGVSTSMIAESGIDKSVINI
jgi:hypothetical protein